MVRARQLERDPRIGTAATVLLFWLYAAALQKDLGSPRAGLDSIRGASEGCWAMVQRLRIVQGYRPHGTRSSAGAGPLDWDGGDCSVVLAVRSSSSERSRFTTCWARQHSRGE